MSNKPTFTVFTGTYNSEAVIHRLFQSVESQTFKDFEWIVIDDRSSDNTVQMLEAFIASHPDLNCTFIKHEKNTGIGGSRKEAIALATGEYFVKWDHDDIQSPDQLEQFYKMWKKYKGQNIAAVWCLCKDQHGKIVGNQYPNDEIVSNYLSLYSGYIYSTPAMPRERHNSIKLDVHNKVNDYLYASGILTPEISPSAADIWSTLALLEYKTVFINQPLRQYFIETDRDRMSNAGRRKNPERVYMDRRNWINFYMTKLPMKDVYVKIRLYTSVIMYGILSGRNFTAILNDIKAFPKKVLVALLFVPTLLAMKIKRV